MNCTIMDGEQEVTMPTLSDATIAIKAGHNNEARAILTDILANDPRNIPALLWMTQVALTTDERREYLRRVLAIDPNNAPAKKGLALLGESDEIPPWMNQEKQPEPETTGASTIDTPIARPTIKQQPVAQVQPPPSQKKWSYIPLVVVAVLTLVFIALFYASRPQAGQTTYQSASIRTPRPAPTRNPWPELASLSQYPYVDELDLVKRPDYYRNQPVCIGGIAFNVAEDKDGTTFMIQDRSTYKVLGTVYYAGSLTGLVDDWYVTVAGYVMGTESDLGISSLYRPVLLMQRGKWTARNSANGYAIGDDHSSYCKQK
jgi:hypothetical protein